MRGLCSEFVLKDYKNTAEPAFFGIEKVVQFVHFGHEMDLQLSCNINVSNFPIMRSEFP